MVQTVARRKFPSSVLSTMKSTVNIWYSEISHMSLRKLRTWSRPTSFGLRSGQRWLQIQKRMKTSQALGHCRPLKLLSYLHTWRWTGNNLKEDGFYKYKFASLFLTEWFLFAVVCSFCAELAVGVEKTRTFLKKIFWTSRRRAQM